MGWKRRTDGGKRWVLLIPSTVLLLLLAGCDGPGGAGQGSAAQATADQFAAALGEGDTAAAQAVFGTEWDITTHMQNELHRFGPAQSAQIERIETNGSSATLHTVWELEGATVRNVWTMEQRGDRWLVMLPSLNAGDRQVTPRD